MKNIYQKQKGFSLVELMVGIAISLIVLAGVGSFYVNTLIANSSKMTVQRADQTLRGLMDYMVSEVRRANYGEIGTTLAGSFSPATGTSNTCVTFSHSTAVNTVDNSGVITTSTDNETFYGFALANNAIYVSKVNKTVPNTIIPISCASFSATALNWTIATDPNTLAVTNFTVDSSAYPVIKLYLAGTVVNQKTAAGVLITRSVNAIVKIRNS